MLAELDATSIWVLSNGAGALAFAGLAVFILTTGRQMPLRHVLLLACVVNASWCALLALAPFAAFGAPLLDSAEAVRSAVWLGVAVVLYGQVATRSRRRWTIAISAIASLVLIGYLLWRLLMTYAFGSVTANHSIALIYGSILISLFGIALLEQVLRGVESETRWALKYLCLGIGTLFAYDFVMYASALVSYRISLAEADARGLVNALVTPLIALAVVRQSLWLSRAQLSRQAVFSTTAIVLGGGYLLFIALGRYVIRNLGGTWSQVFAVTFVVATGVVFLVLVFSGQVRAHARVLLNKHFFRYKYDYRAEWLALADRLIQTRTQDEDDAYQRAIRAVAQLLDCPSGALWLRREADYVCVSHWNLGGASDTVVDAESQLVTFLYDTGWVLHIDARQGGSDIAAQGLSVPTWLTGLPNVWLLLPLSSNEGLLGFVVLASPRAHYRLTWEDFDLLKAVGRQVGVYLQQQENSQALAQARQFEAFNRLTAFLMHDLKNIANQQSLMLQNARKYKHEPEFVDDMIATIDQSVDRINTLLSQLKPSSATGDNAQRVAVDDVLADVAMRLAKRSPTPGVAARAPDAVVQVDRDRLTRVVENLVRNAQDATSADGTVTLRASVKDGAALIDVVDTGAGMTAAFIRDSLFKPFYTTKSAQGMGIGAYEARDFARAAGGDVDVTSDVGRGTTFSLTLPLTLHRSPNSGAQIINNKTAVLT